MIKTLFRAFLLGLGVGVLLAPRAGSETRRLLSEKLNTALDKAAELSDNLTNSIEDARNTSYTPSQHAATTDREASTADRMAM